MAFHDAEFFSFVSEFPEWFGDEQNQTSASSTSTTGGSTRVAWTNTVELVVRRPVARVESQLEKKDLMSKTKIKALMISS